MYSNNTSHTTASIDRRAFLAGTALAGSLAAAGIMGGSTPRHALADSVSDESSDADISDESSNSDSFDENAIIEEIDTDIVVVGAGISGLAAAVQAAELGAKVVQLECQAVPGGNGRGTEGVFAVGSRRQQEQGIELTLADIVASELDFSKNKVNALFWKDMAEKSAADIDWLESNGVMFNETVDEYPPMGKVKVFHWFKDGDAANYIDPMSAKAVELGVEQRFETRARRLVMDGNAVAGVLAQTSKGTLKINASAVILASGGFSDSPAKLETAGIDSSLTWVRSFGGHMGDGLDMAVQAGARDDSRSAAFLCETTVHEGLEVNYPATVFLFSVGTPVWVNGDGERFCDENCVAVTSGCMSNACRAQENPFAVFSRNILEDAAPSVSMLGDLVSDVEGLVERASDDMYAADTVEELAEQMGVPADTLAATIERYNGFCASGTDEDFAKDSTQLTALSNAPFYAARLKCCYMSSIGGIATDRKGEVLRADKTPVPGLYAVGADGCQLYYGTYTISVPGSFNGNNVYSGCNAARNAIAYLG